ncbi:hypothetical protein BKA70DRAFT_1431036 [Coprinopsis sp. MPI-PUGE-AT-0042]|nr:hypothetical protein BKA70DRAFT_1431036 [Coprinopsis sp. MPI-PUGE-AT-0042]
MLGTKCRVLEAGQSLGCPPEMASAHGFPANNVTFLRATRDVHFHVFESQPGFNTRSALRLVWNFRQIHQDVLGKATPGTWLWFFKTEKFVLWLDPNGDLKILWGTGIPGAGKTVLASIVIRELESRAKAAGGTICVCYIYFRYSYASDLTTRNILEILVKQTVERHPDCASFAEDAHDLHLREKTQPTETELLQLLHRFTLVKLATFYILDALDEAPIGVQLALIKMLASLNVRLFVTSRPVEVESRIPGVHSFPIVAQEVDLDLHITQEIARSWTLQGLLNKAGSSLRDEVMSLVKSNCGGMAAAAARRTRIAKRT